MPSIINATTSTGLVSSADNSGSLQLATNNGTTAVTIDTSQRVGVGTTSPQRKVSIVGTDGASGQTEGNSRTSLFLDNNGANYLTIMTSTSGDGGVFFSDNGSNNGGMVYETSSDALYFRANNAERMRIISGGNVSIGTTSNIARLGVLFDGNTDNGEILRTSTNASGAGFLYFQQDTNTCGSVVRVGTTSAVTYSSTSDYRLKENVMPMTNGLDKVSRLKPVTYTWKQGGESAEGFIAHELAEVCPDAVVGTKDQVETYLDEDGNEQTRPKYQSIDTSFLVATLTSALQELNAKVEAQAVRIAELEGAR
jgi:hypothetical protein